MHLQVVANVTAAELARRLEKEGVILADFFAGGWVGWSGCVMAGRSADHGLQVEEGGGGVGPHTGSNPYTPHPH